MSRSGGKAARVVLLLFAAAVVAAGCGFGEPETAKSLSGAPARKPVVTDTETVAAVGNVRGGTGLVSMRFALSERPRVGEPVDIEISLLPSAPLERLFVRFQAAQGLQIVSGGQTEQLQNAPSGVAIGHKVTVLPKGDGIFYITAVVIADSDKESISSTFSIPLIAGEGLAAAPAITSEPPAANTSEPPRGSPGSR